MFNFPSPITQLTIIQAACCPAARLRPCMSPLSLCLLGGALHTVIIDRTNQYSLDTPVNLYGKHHFTVIRPSLHAYTQAQVNVSGYGLVIIINAVCSRLTLLPEMPSMLPFPTQSLDSTQIMLQLHSTFALACDNSTSLDSTHTVPILMKPRGCVPILPPPTNSNRIR